MYYTKSYKEDPKKIEMSFDCTNYQHQFRMDHDARVAPVKYENHVFQSIFLDKENRELWTMEEIDESMMFLNGKNHTWFAGSWTLVVSDSKFNMHELACISGIAAAYRLGADYVKFYDFAEDLFSKYLLVSQGVKYNAEQKRRKQKHN
ncbi:hypothetical protein G7Y89_g9415 [Cudoniella acicularis]|uniref:Uncharacterized protein n=1 Tax=Cudoniella acicularis TaxID=354080 RepID=A0A8H4W1X3_9HELO|nr:hypothetical protein G7Y89_g9415 [Cudoniella acicularis]